MSRRSVRAEVPLGIALLAALTLYLFFPVAQCIDSCTVDHIALRGAQVGAAERPDTRINTWILAWVQHALITQPSELFNANIFYPAPATLTQSEHMLGTALVTLPLRAFTSNALLIHQAALIFSTLMLTFTTFALVLWLTRSTFASLIAGACAAFMPWRYAELAHLQLMSVQWMPLVWLGIGRILLRPGQRRDTLLLSLSLTLQLLNSFYLAYFTLFSSAVLVTVIASLSPIDKRAFRSLAWACLAPGLLLLLVAIPYLRWSSNFGFHALFELPDSLSVAQALSLTLPELGWPLSGALRYPIDYRIPLGVVAAGVCSLIAPRSEPAQRNPRRTFAWALFAMCMSCFVMMLGRTLQIGDHAIPLPSYWASILIPGFENLRGPARWAIPISVACPILAGIGIFHLEKHLSLHGYGPLHVGALRGFVLVAIFATLPTVQVPARDGWDGIRERRAGYRALAALPMGPVIEIPWVLQPQIDIERSSQYMLGSTLHWRPITNGTSGYLPPSYPLLRQIAQQFPDPDAIARIRQLIDARWIVLHPSGLPGSEIDSWRTAVSEGTLTRVYADHATWILEIHGWERPSPSMDGLRSAEPRARTLAGLSRAPLELLHPAGTLEIEVPDPLEYLGRSNPNLARVRIVNGSDQPWPGLDVQDDGLLRLRYAFTDDDGNTVITRTAALAADVPEQESITLRVPIDPPPRSGHYRLRVDLVQRADPEDRPIPVDPVELSVRVTRSRWATPAPDGG